MAGNVEDQKAAAAARRALWATWADEGLTLHQAAECAGMSYESFRKKASNYRLRFRGCCSVRQEERIATVRGLAAEGLCATEIGRRMGHDRTTIYRWAKLGKVNIVSHQERCAMARETAAADRERERQEAMQRWHDRMAEARLAKQLRLATMPSGPVDMLVAIIDRDGRVPPEVAVRLRPETVQAAMARLAERESQARRARG